MVKNTDPKYCYIVLYIKLEGWGGEGVTQGGMRNKNIQNKVEIKKKRNVHILFRNTEVNYKKHLKRLKCFPQGRRDSIEEKAWVKGLLFSIKFLNTVF